MTRRAVVTGAFSNIGSAVARDLCEGGWEVSTLTNRRSPAGDAGIPSHPLRFDREHLVRVLDGADVFVNTYWIRFPFGGVDFEDAARNSGALFAASRDAGVRRTIHVSVSNASVASPLGYYRGKGEAEELLSRSGISHAIVRPTLVVGPNDVLTGNIAWLLRRLPVFGIPAGQGYQMQPVTLDDVARIICDQVEGDDAVTVDAAGPEIVSFREYVSLLARVLGRRVWMPTVPPRVALAALRPLGWWLHDTILTAEELDGLRTGMLVSHAPPLGGESVVDWVREHASSLGTHYTNDTVERFARFATAIRAGR